MPWTLYRYILRELLKVLVLTTAVLVVVLSFGTAIGPLADGLLGPVSLIKFVLYSMPTVLGFALPFSGAFAATVVFHGMTKDNEILACRAGGMSYSRIFAPVVGLGIALMAVLLILSNTVVPGFWKAAKKTVEGDVLGVLVSQLNQNRPYMLGDDGLVLYADAAEVREPPAGSGTQGLTAQQFIVMQGVAVGQFDKQSRRVLNDTTASTASALLVRDDLGKSYITLRLQDPVYYDAVTGELARIGQFGEVETDRPIPLPNPIDDEAVFFTFKDLMDLKRNPHSFDSVRSAKADLAATVSRQQLNFLIREGLAGDRGFVTLMGGMEGTYYRLSAPLVESNDKGLVLAGSDQMKVTVDRYDNAQLMGDPIRRFEADYAELSVRTGRFDREPEVRLMMRNVRVMAQTGSSAINEKAEYVFPPMRYSQQVLGVDPASLSADELNDWSRKEEIRDAPGVQQARAWLSFRIIQLKYMIDAELYTRLANAFAMLLLLVLGSLLAVRLHEKLPLTVFFWSFVLAIVTLVMIRTGDSMAQRVSFEHIQQGFAIDRMIGLGVLWGGNLLLLILIARSYLKIAKN